MNERSANPEKESHPSKYFSAQLYGSTAVGLAIIGGVEAFTDISEKVTDITLGAGLGIGIIALITIVEDCFANRRD